MARKTELWNLVPEMILILLRVIGLDMHAVAGQGAGYLTLGIQRQLLDIDIGNLAHPMAEINTMTLTTQGVLIKSKLSLGGSERKPAVQALLCLQMTHLATSIDTMRRRFFYFLFSTGFIRSN